MHNLVGKIGRYVPVLSANSYHIDSEALSESKLGYGFVRYGRMRHKHYLSNAYIIELKGIFRAGIKFYAALGGESIYIYPLAAHIEHIPATYYGSRPCRMLAYGAKQVLLGVAPAHFQHIEAETSSQIKFGYGFAAHRRAVGHCKPIEIRLQLVFFHKL